MNRIASDGRQRRDELVDRALAGVRQRSGAAAADELREAWSTERDDRVCEQAQTLIDANLQIERIRTQNRARVDAERNATFLQPFKIAGPQVAGLARGQTRAHREHVAESKRMDEARRRKVWDQ